MEYADCNWNGAMTSVSAPFFVPIFMGTKIGNDTDIWKGVDIRNCLVETKKHTKKVSDNLDDRQQHRLAVIFYANA